MIVPCARSDHNKYLDSIIKAATRLYSLLLTVALVFCGCATISNDDNQRIDLKAIDSQEHEKLRAKCFITSQKGSTARDRNI